MSPIIFCHYGNTNYLFYTLFAAKKSNPNKDIYLIGDSSNLYLANKIGISHYDFRKFDNNNLIKEFNTNFKFIAGNNHGRLEWTRFVFQRWFYVNEFVKLKKFDSFWHFDSDNLIITDLFAKEEKFKKYDNTEQCGGMCLNGFISNVKIPSLYTQHILDLFNDELFLELQKQKCLLNNDFAFTEMAAYNSFKKKYNTDTFRLNNLDSLDTFDDCLACSDGFILTNEKYNGYHIKQIFINKKNEIYFKLLNEDQYVKVNSINLSWLPFSIVLRIFHLNFRKRIKLFKYFNIIKKNEYSKVDFIRYSFFNKMLDKLIFKYLKVN